MHWKTRVGETMTLKINPFLKSIKFWILFFLVLRLYGINNAPLERGHDWRQCLTAMMTRNFYENGPDMLYPKVDNGGRHESGIIASEFPIYNLICYGLCVPFGYQHWIMRLINLLLASLAIWLFYLILKSYYPQRVAFIAAFILNVSIWFGFSRKIMPDTFSISLMITAFYFLMLYLKRSKAVYLILYGIFCASSILAKLPAVYALSLLALPLIHRPFGITKKISLLMVTGIALAIAYWWYFLWGQFLLRTYGYQLYFPQSFADGYKLLIPHKEKALEQFYFSAFQSFVAFLMFGLGLYCLIKQRKVHTLVLFLLSFMVFALFIVKTGDVFALHSYYIIPFVPVMALIAGIGLAYLPSLYQGMVLAIIALESLGNQHHDFFIKESEKFKMELEDEINQWIPQDEKIAMAGSTGPQYLYFSHRKGWGISTEQCLDTAYMRELKLRNYKYLVLVKREFKKWPDYEMIANSKNVAIFKF